MVLVIVAKIDTDAPVSERKIVMRRSIVKISNLAKPKPPPNSFGFWADHGVRGYLHNGQWKYF
jgi:hypothetical protein